MAKNAWIIWAGVSLFFGCIAIRSFLSYCKIKDELNTLSTEGGLMLARKRELELQGKKPLNLGRFTLDQLKNLQWYSFLGALGGIFGALMSALLSF